MNSLRASLVLIIIVETIVVYADDCFRAAVYEHVPLGNITHNPVKDIITNNLNQYEKVAKIAASMGAKIIVYPEDGIIDPNGCSRVKAQEFIEEIPNPHDGKYNPCNDPQKYQTRQILYRLSCIAKNNNIYIVADMGDSVPCNKSHDSNCPNDNHYQFNTAVAFDSNGNLIAKYHKMHLFLEYMYNVPPKPEFIFFDTPFGRMGMHICFDILYNTPGIRLIEEYKVTTMVFPTWWFDSILSLSATNVQQSYAITNKINFLAANIHVPKTGSMGSGIYSGNYGAIVYTHNADNKSKLLIANIPINSRNATAQCLNNANATIIPFNTEETKEIENYQNIMDTDTEGMIFKKLENINGSFNVCSNGFCCHLNYTVFSKETLINESYYFGIANRTLNDHYPMCEETCGVMRCDGNSTDPCQTFPISVKNTIFTQLHLSGKFTTKYVYPSVTTNHLKLVPRNKWEYINNENTEDHVHLKLNQYNEPILFSGLYGRCYNRDPPYKQ